MWHGGRLIPAEIHGDSREVVLISWEKTITKLLGVVSLNSIRSKIITFALLATLLPSLTMGWLSYRNNLKILDEKISKELTSVTSQSSREVELWLKDRQYEVRVFASSYEISENLDAITSDRSNASTRKLAASRIAAYLRSVEPRFADYDELAVLKMTGDVVATSAPAPSRLPLPSDWQEEIRSGGFVVGDPYWDRARKQLAMVGAEAIHSGPGNVVGVIAVKLTFAGVDALLARQAKADGSRLLVVTRKGLILSSSPAWGETGAVPRLRTETAARLFEEAGTPHQYTDISDEIVVGLLHAVPRLGWGVVAQINKAAEYAGTARIRDVTVLLVLSVLIGIGAAGYVLGFTLVRPLDRLIRGAGKVAAGDLDVDLPVIGGGEIGYLTIVFNRMVARLRKAREEIEATNAALLAKNEELHEKSVTDGLTGLHNRKHMNETVFNELSRAWRHGHPVSILMMDIDRFKAFNDTRGHQAGDDVLVGVAAVLKETVRETDYIARYGGEEFLILLPFAGREVATHTAERIRARVEEACLGRNAAGQAITVSIGVATSPECGVTAEDVIREADLALYRAKAQGRNRVVAASFAQTKEAELEVDTAPVTIDSGT